MTLYIYSRFLFKNPSTMIAYRNNRFFVSYMKNPYVLKVSQNCRWSYFELGLSVWSAKMQNVNHLSDDSRVNFCTILIWLPNWVIILITKIPQHCKISLKSRSKVCNVANLMTITRYLSLKTIWRLYLCFPSYQFKTCHFCKYIVLTSS